VLYLVGHVNWPSSANKTTTKRHPKIMFGDKSKNITKREREYKLKGSTGRTARQLITKRPTCDVMDETGVPGKI
jgi:hypothetical protein